MMHSLPLRLDLFTLLMLLGVAQGWFLAAFLLTGARRRDRANRCFGWFMVAQTTIMTEIWLEYSNYMFRTLWLVDVAEPANFAIGPLLWGFATARLTGHLPRRWGWHLLPTVLWALNAVTWLAQPIEYHYNSYISAFHPELPFVPHTLRLPEDVTGLREYINELTLLSTFIYSALSLRAVARAFRRAGLRLLGPAPALLRAMRLLYGQYALFPLLILWVKLTYPEDLGDHLLVAFLTLMIYVVSALVMSGSVLFRPTVASPNVVVDTASAGNGSRSGAPASAVAPEPSRRKYERSALSAELEEALLQKLTRLMTTEKPYLSSELSLPKLAEQLQTSPHYVSQVLNDRLGQSFFDLLATYRIREAQQLLQDPATAHFKIDEIAERVGYNSVSAFHTAFKRQTGQTPAQFRAATASSR